MTKRNVSGLWVAALTPLDRDGACDVGRLAAHCRFLFDAGADGVALFGTTGEGPSFTVVERRRALEGVLAAGIPARRVMLGTGASALADAAELNRAATDAGCAGALLLPPFFFKQIDGEGCYRAFAEAIEMTRDPHLKVYLYQIPSHSGVSIDLDVIDRLARGFPGVVAGVKDSTLDWRHTEPLLARFPQLEILVGAEQHVTRAIAAGGSGTICGLANVAPELVRALVDAPGEAAAAGDLKRMDSLIRAFEPFPFVAAVKSVAAAQKGDDAWLAVRAPLHLLSAVQSDELRRHALPLAALAALANA